MKITIDTDKRELIVLEPVKLEALNNFVKLHYLGGFKIVSSQQNSLLDLTPKDNQFPSPRDTNFPSPFEPTWWGGTTQLK